MLVRRPLAAVLLAAAASTLPAQTPPPWVADVDALVAARLQRRDAVGFSVGIAQRGEVLLARGYGKAELEFGAAADADTMFRIGSVTKQVTAALIVRAAEQEQLSLDDGLEKFVPTFPLQGRKVTIRQLLNHSSGIPSYTSIGAAWEKQSPLEVTHDELLALVANKPFDFEPGTDWSYDNTGYYLLGMVLEKVHGKPYAQVVAEQVAAPLGLQRTRYDSNRELMPNRAQGYSSDDGKLRNDDLLGTTQPGAAGALLSTGGDLVRWSMALAGGKVVSAAGHAQMTTPLVLGTRDTRYGFGLMTGELACLKTVTHGGGINGFNSVLTHVVEPDLHVAVISNSERASSQNLAEAIVRKVLAIATFVAKDLPIPVVLRDELVGEYGFEQMPMKLRVAVVGDGLEAKGQAEGQRAFRLLFQGEREFRAEFDHEVKLVFGADGALTLHQNGRVLTGGRR